MTIPDTVYRHQSHGTQACDCAPAAATGDPVRHHRVLRVVRYTVIGAGILTWSLFPWSLPLALTGVTVVTVLTWLATLPWLWS